LARKTLACAFPDAKNTLSRFARHVLMAVKLRSKNGAIRETIVPCGRAGPAVDRQKDISAFAPVAAAGGLAEQTLA